jgi:hypothetical protein
VIQLAAPLALNTAVVTCTVRENIVIAHRFAADVAYREVLPATADTYAICDLVRWIPLVADLAVLGAILAHVADHVLFVVIPVTFYTFPMLTPTLNTQGIRHVGRMKESVAMVTEGCTVRAHPTIVG